MFCNAGVLAATLLLNKKHQTTFIRCDLLLAEDKLNKTLDKMCEMRLQYIGWRNKIRKFLRMKQLKESDAHQVLAHPSDVFDRMVGYCALQTEVEYLQEAISCPVNIKRGYYERMI